MKPTVAADLSKHRACDGVCVRLNAAKERSQASTIFMMTRAELQLLDLNMLAMYCQRVSESYPWNSAEAEQARELKRDWVQLIGYVKPPIPGIHTPEDRARFTKELIERMIDLLANCNLPANGRGSGLQSVAGGNGTSKSKKSTA